MNQPFEEQGEERSEGIKIDYKRVLYRLLKYWYLAVLSVAIGWTFAFLKNRYAVRIYSVSASVLIKEKEESNGADLLYNNSIIDAYRNYLNEPYILRSYPLIGSVVERLNFEVAFYQQGNFKTTELYGLPVRIHLLKRNGSYGASLNFKALDEKSYLITSPGGIKDPGMIFHFNDSVNYKGHHFIVIRDSTRSIEEIKNNTLLVTFLDPLAVTGSYVGRLGVSWAEKGAGILNLSVSGPNPEKESDFMMGLITTYQQYDLERKNQSAERTVQFIKRQLKEISDSLKIFEHQLDEFKIYNSTDKLDEESSKLFDKLSILESQKTELILKGNYYDYLNRYLSKGDNYDLVVLPSSVGIAFGLSQRMERSTRSRETDLLGSAVMADWPPTLP